jgi:hypothetical protein
MKRFWVTIEHANGARTSYQVRAANHTAAGARGLAIIRRQGFAARLVRIGESE